MTASNFDFSGRPPSPAPSKSVKTCPSCGRISRLVYEPNCLGCGAVLSPPSVTSDDNTPYAEANASGKLARRQMRRWIYWAGADRIMHLSLIRPSVPSRQFARWQLLTLALAMTFLQIAHVGFHRVIRTPDNAMLLQSEPTGRAWRPIATDADASPVTYGSLAIWWNPAQTAIATPISFLSALILAYIMMSTLQAGTRLTIVDAATGERRLQGALHYVTAFATPILAAAAIVLLIPIRHVMHTIGLPLTPPVAPIYGLAAIVAAIATTAWWFWHIRLAHTLPMRIRTSVTLYYAVVAPIIVASLGIGWRVGLDHLFEFSWPLLNLHW